MQSITSFTKKRLKEKGCACPYAYTMEKAKRIIHSILSTSGSTLRDDISSLLAGGKNLIYYTDIDPAFGGHPDEVAALKEMVYNHGAQLITQLYLQFHQKKHGKVAFPLEVSVFKKIYKQAINNEQDLCNGFNMALRKISAFEWSDKSEENYFITYMGPIYTPQNTGSKNPDTTLHGRYAPEHIIVIVPFSDFDDVPESTMDHIEEVLKKRHSEGGLKEYREIQSFFISPLYCLAFEDSRFVTG